MKVMKKMIGALLSAALVCVCAGCGQHEAASVTFFKAGKADAAVVKTESCVILVDTGLQKNGGELVEALEDMGVERIDVLIVSHFDKDHVGGAAAVLEAFGAGAVYQSNHPKDSGEYRAYVQALADAGIEPVTVSGTLALELDGLAVSIDGPDETEYDDDPSNNSSLIVTVSLGGDTVVFAGDAEDARITEYLADYERPAGRVILKVPYHGHWQKTLPELFSAMLPDMAVISCSKKEPDGDELARTVSLLESHGAQVYLTYEGDFSAALGQ